MEQELAYTHGNLAMKILRPHEVTAFPEFRELTPEELKEAYALARAAFTAEDLQKFTEVYEVEFLFKDVIAELEQQEEELSRKKA
jgi:hypothetical protein